MGTGCSLTDDNPAAEPSLAEDVIELRLLTSGAPAVPGWAREHHNLHPQAARRCPPRFSLQREKREPAH
jgi:hypothetical protein